MRYQGVFFDFDYTLGDSTIPITIGFQQSFLAMGLEPPARERVRPTIGMTLMDAYTLLTGDAREEKRREFYDLFQRTVGEKSTGEFSRAMEEETVLFPGAEALLRALHGAGIRVAIVSTKNGNTIRRILTRMGLTDLVDLIVGGADVTRSKPDPEGLNFALRELGLAAEKVLFCGDTVIDARTAQNGGTDFCAVLNGTTSAEAFAPLPSVHIAPDLDDLHRWLCL